MGDEISRYSEVPQIPENSYKWQATIRYSDQDSNLHTSQSVYIKLCIDGATSAALNGKLKHFTEDMCFYPVDYLDITYIAESFPEDQLVINLWPDEREPSVLYFLITRNSKNMIYAIIKFGLTKLVPVQHSRL